MVRSKKRIALRTRNVLGVLAAMLALVAASASSASAIEVEAPEWEITSYTMPTHLAPEGTGQLVVTAVNVGGAATDGSTITIEDSLPSGVIATGIWGVDVYANSKLRVVRNRNAPAATMTCASLPELSCTWNGVSLPGDQVVVTIEVEVEPGAPASSVNQATVSGGGAASASAGSPVTISEEPAGFGLAPGSVLAAVSSHQAGAHANVTTGFAMNTTGVFITAGSPRDVAFDMPPGAVGNTVGMPRCNSVLAMNQECPASTIVGLATAVFQGLQVQRQKAPVFNIEPAPGEPAAFMFVIQNNIPVRLDTTVLSNGNYGVRVTAGDLSAASPLYTSYVTIWGVPADHEGPGPVEVFGDRYDAETVGSPSEAAVRVPLLSNPTQCGRPLTAIAETDAWRTPGVFQKTELPMGAMTGCLQLPFESSFSFLPDTLESGAPAGYEFDLNVNTENTPDLPSASDVKAVSLALPEGVVVNPSAAWGLKACSAADFYGPNHPSQEPAEEAKCPREAKVGSVWIKTPALEEALEGSVFLAEPECKPCTPQEAEDGKMVKLYVQAVSEGEGGIVIKLEGKGMIDQKTGRITTVFDENPQLPFDHFKLRLAGGPRAVLANPRTCGTVTAAGDLRPWSSLLGEGELGTVGDSTPKFEVEINQNCHGAEFHPFFKAGMPDIQAGEYGEFTLAFGRPDNSEFLSSIETHMPEGLMGSLNGVELCKEAQASSGTCGSNSQIGEVQVLSGPGANPFLVEGGKVFLTEGYGDAPFGLSIVVPAVAGPYTLAGTTGNGTVVVRAQIFVDEHTAQLTVKSGPMPSMLDGIPLQLKAVNVRINRPHFMFNPTSCDKMAITGSIDAVEGLTANVESPLQVANCARLPFKPKFRAYTKAHHSRKHGAYLHVTLESGSGQANIREVHVELPKAMPSVLKTLQQACTEQQFAKSPEGCPAGSIVGHAKAITPLVPVPIEGPAYFVSHGGAKFPELVMVLKGYGITVVLNGETFISKAGITSSTFKTVPDVPVTRFDLVLPEGKNPALTGNGDLCAKKLTMPTRLVGQSGKVRERNTKVHVRGCKPAIEVVKHSAKGHGRATIVVQVPSAGKLVASGGGIVKSAKRAGKAKRVAIGVKLDAHARKLLAKHRNRRLKVTVHLRFDPKHGHTLTGHVSVLMH